jgi:hypothetical protein
MDGAPAGPIGGVVDRTGGASRGATMGDGKGLGAGDATAVGVGTGDAAHAA